MQRGIYGVGEVITKVSWGKGTGWPEGFLLLLKDSKGEQYKNLHVELRSLLEF